MEDYDLIQMDTIMLIHLRLMYQFEKELFLNDVYQYNTML
jgi:hypothetical protein